MATFLGNVEDLTRDLLGKAQQEEEHCRTSLDTYDAEVKTLRREADDASVALANTATEHSELESLRRERRKQVQDVNADAEREVGTCAQQLADFDATMCSAAKLKKELGEKAGKGQFIGDCEVGDWQRSPCSASCGTTGEQTLKREVISSTGSSAKCPSLEFKRPCNRRPCPVDSLMDQWEEWSGCSRACGGGTRARHRRVIRQAEHGGLPAAETMQEQLCNAFPCDSDCTFLDWSAWTACSKNCFRGHQKRIRKVAKAALGDGSCPSELAPERLQTKPCNKKACAKVQPLSKCTAALDVVIVLDVSGSLGEAGTAKVKDFAKLFLLRLQLGPLNDKIGSTVGVVAFGSKATVKQTLTATSAELLNNLMSITWEKTSTNTAQALAVARTVLEEKSRGPKAQQVVVVITDGMPESAFLAGVEAGRLKAQGARLAFVPVGKAVSSKALQHWASWPWEENILPASSYNALDDKKVTELLANLCSGADFTAKEEEDPKDATASSTSDTTASTR